jgi:hypothetical protein
VTLVRRGGFSSASEEREIIWPTGWRLPVPAERVVVGDWGGVVEQVELHPAENRVLVVLR